jgi:hypothetical protein
MVLNSLICALLLAGLTPKGDIQYLPDTTQLAESDSPVISNGEEDKLLNKGTLNDIQRQLDDTEIKLNETLVKLRQNRYHKLSQRRE